MLTPNEKPYNPVELLHSTFKWFSEVL